MHSCKATMIDGSEAMIINSSIVIRYNSAMGGLSVNYADTSVVNGADYNLCECITSNNVVPTKFEHTNNMFSSY